MSICTKYADQWKTHCPRQAILAVTTATALVLGILSFLQVQPFHTSGVIGGSILCATSAIIVAYTCFLASRSKHIPMNMHEKDFHKVEKQFKALGPNAYVYFFNDDAERILRRNGQEDKVVDMNYYIPDPSLILYGFDSSTKTLVPCPRFNLIEKESDVRKILQNIGSKLEKVPISIVKEGQQGSYRAIQNDASLNEIPRKTCPEQIYCLLQHADGSYFAVPENEVYMYQPVNAN